jgi:hypothetical protein
MVNYFNTTTMKINLRQNIEKNDMNLAGIERMKNNIVQLQQEKTRLDSIKQERDKLRPEEMDKLLLKIDRPDITYNYLLNITDKFAPDFSFNFNPSAGSQNDIISSNYYELVGNSSIEQLHKFVFNLEEQPLFYEIDDLSVSSLNASKQDTVSFNMKVRSFYGETGIEPDEADFKNYKRKKYGASPFYSKIHSPLPVNEELLNLNQLELIGLNPQEAFLEDKDGKVHVLKPGQKIQYGYFSYINWKQQKAIFRINKVGLNKNIVLKLAKEEK